MSSVKYQSREGVLSVLSAKCVLRFEENSETYLQMASIVVND